MPPLRADFQNDSLWNKGEAKSIQMPSPQASRQINGACWSPTAKAARLNELIIELLKLLGVIAPFANALEACALPSARP